MSFINGNSDYGIAFRRGRVSIVGFFGIVVAVNE